MQTCPVNVAHITRWVQTVQWDIIRNMHIDGKYTHVWVSTAGLLSMCFVLNNKYSH